MSDDQETNEGGLGLADRRRSSKGPGLLAKLLLLGCMTLICILAMEFALRAIVNPGDWLRPQRIFNDPIVRWRVVPGVSGHDDWGFRNVAVPEHAEIVAVGDSMTYGNLAPIHQSWPGWLSEMTGETTYSLALGGYGPIEYRHLVETYAFRLSPRVIVVGLYMGNDFIDSFRAVYEREHWSFLRSAEIQAQIDSGALAVRPGGVRVVEPETTGLAAFRRSLGERSVLYRMAGTSLAAALRPISSDPDEALDRGIITHHGPGGELRTMVAPGERFPAVDLSDPRVIEGLRLSLEAISYIKGLCDERGIDFLVVAISTKTSVLAPGLTLAASGKAREQVEVIRRNESELLARVLAYLEQHDIEYVETFDALQAAAKNPGFYANSADAHPMSEGYRVIASQISQVVE